MAKLGAWFPRSRRNSRLFVLLAASITSEWPTIRPECELGLGCMYSSPSARFSALQTFQAFGNSEKPPRNNGLRGALAVE
jgi:hypothetical protein